MSGEGLIEEAARRLFTTVPYKDDPEVEDCPNCFPKAFHVGEDLCLVCEDGRPNPTCERCAAERPVTDQDGPLCEYCAHVMAKAMEEDD